MKTTPEQRAGYAKLAEAQLPVTGRTELAMLRDAIRALLADLEEVKAENATLRQQLEAFHAKEKDTSEWLCECCNVVRPYEPRHGLLHPCPTCGYAMLPTSVNIREHKAALIENNRLRQQLVALLTGLEAELLVTKTEQLCRSYSFREPAP